MIRKGLFTAFICLNLAAPAAAQEAGVFVDPDSPAGKEYAIPLEEARRHAAGGGGSEGSGGGQPLFGAGIERAPSPDGPAQGGTGGAGDSGGEGDGAARGDRGAGANSSPEASDGDQAVRRSAAIKAAAGGSSDGLLTAAIVALVLLAGLLAGVALRRTLGSE